MCASPELATDRSQVKHIKGKHEVYPNSSFISYYIISVAEIMCYCC